MADPSPTPLRVIQWATGGVGRAAIEGILLHPDLELVGCYVHSDEKSGMDVGELIGREPIGVLATNDSEAVFALDADAVIYAPLVGLPVEVDALLRSGKNVITPVGWIYPNARHRAKLADAGLAGAATLHGTGINPGGVPDLHPLMFSALSSGVRYLRGEEFSDIRSYGAPDVVRDVMCFGKTPDEARSGPMLELLSAGFSRSVQMCLDTVGFAERAKITAALDLAVATAAIESPIGTIEPGQVAGQRFVWRGTVDDAVVVEVAVNWLMGEENLEPAWTFGPEGERFEIEVRGDPDTFATIKGWQPDTIADGLIRNPGVVATAMHCVNSVLAVVAAPPGVVTYLDLPLVTGRAHPDLA